MMHYLGTGDLSGAPTFRGLVRRLRKVVNSAIAHVDFPFSRLLELLQGESEAGKTPIFQVRRPGLELGIEGRLLDISRHRTFGTSSLHVCR